MSVRRQADRVGPERAAEYISWRPYPRSHQIAARTRRFRRGVSWPLPGGHCDGSVALAIDAGALGGGYWAHAGKGLAEQNKTGG